MASEDVQASIPASDTSGENRAGAFHTWNLPFDFGGCNDASCSNPTDLLNWYECDFDKAREQEKGRRALQNPVRSSALASHP